jgi:RHS repeat-associated protein
LNDGEIFDPSAQNFGSVKAAPAPLTGNLKLAGSIPPDGASDVALNTVLALRFATALQVETVTSATVTLSGPRGVEATGVVAAEAGQLAFVRPQQDLLAGARYTLAIQGATDPDGRVIEPAAVTFTTAGSTSTTASKGSGGRSAEGTTPSEAAKSNQASGERSAGPHDEEWVPGAAGWRSNRPESSWRSLPPLKASGGVTALAGQVLRLNGEPLADVTLAVGGASARTDATGRFLLTGAEPGVYALVIDGRTANQPGRVYGRFEANIELKAGETVVVPYTIWLPKLDTQHAVTIPTYTSSEVIVTTPRIPGLEFRIPAHAAIRDHEGKPVTEVSITPVPLDRPPFPLPAGVDVPVYFTIQPGGAYVYTKSGKGAALVYPNSIEASPHTKFQFWDYHAERKGWYVYGLGTVTADGVQVVPDPGVRIYELTAAMVEGQNGNASPDGKTPAANSDRGDPVDLSTGLFVLSKTDLALSDVIPIALKRTYRSRETISRAFGIGASHPYDIFLVGNSFPYTWQDLVLADGGRLHYERISPGTSWTDAIYEHTTTPTPFYKSRMVWNGNGWTITLKDGSQLMFPESFGGTRPQWSAMTEFRDRFGNRVVLTRNAARNLTRITSPSGRTIDFTYDGSNRVTQATDLIGRTVTYAYDAGGRLIRVTDPAAGVTEYTYDAAHRMLTLKDARGITFLTNQYDAAGRVVLQTQADATTYQFAYTLDPATGKIGQADVTDPRGTVERLTFNTAGYPLTNTRALGTALAHTTTFARDATSNAVSSSTDSLGRSTAYTYDAFGNLTSVTGLAGTADAVTTSLTYEPAFNQLASVTDPLSHTTTVAYDSRGALSTITDALGNSTTFTTNEFGRPLTITTAAGTTTLGYLGTDLMSLTDPLGNVTRRFVDAAGRVASATTPLGQRTRYDYDALNRLTAITHALAGVTQFSYDANGNLLSLSDARSHATAWTYSPMDRVATRTDPLLRAESYVYDGNGNLLTVTDRKSQATGRAYDALNRVTQITHGDGSTTSYTWDAGNRLTQITDSVAGIITRTYDGLDRLTTETTPQGSVSYNYDAAGRRTSMTVAGQPTVTYTYDAANRLIGVTQGSAIVGFAYDGANRRTMLTLPNGTSTEYAYDVASRLTDLTYKAGSTVLGTLTYTYDAAGNRVGLSGTWARTGLPAAVSGATYDAANQQITFGNQTLTYDLNGNLLSDGVNTYTWNARNELIAINGAVAASFGYDGLGRRRTRTINGTTTSLLYDGLNPVQEQGGAAIANLMTGLVLDEFFTRTAAAGTQTFLSDGIGSTVALTDPAGSVQAGYTYEAFGATTLTGTTSNIYDFTGRENDGTDLKYYRARYYHPGLARFISEDPIRMQSGDLNFYAYVANNPLLFSDPLGMMSAAQGACLSGAAALLLGGGIAAEVGGEFLVHGVRLMRFHPVIGGVVAGIGVANEIFGLGAMYFGYRLAQGCMNDPHKPLSPPDPNKPDSQSQTGQPPARPTKSESPEAGGQGYL